MAGIAIVHELTDGIGLGPVAPGSEWGATAPAVTAAGAIRIRHLVGDTEIRDAGAVFEVGPHASYHDLGAGRIAVLMSGLVPDVPRLLLVTVEPGSKYEMRYASVPGDPVPRNISEIPAYALALAARRGGVLAHGCGFVMPSGRAALCLGVSGAGKSTLARIMQTVPGVRVLNDDRIVLADRGTGMRAWSTPWPGRAGIARVGDAPLGVIGVIGRGAAPKVSPLAGRVATSALLQTLAVPAWSPEQAGAALDVVATLQGAVPIVRLEYPLGGDTGRWLLDTLEERAT